MRCAVSLAVLVLAIAVGPFPAAGQNWDAVEIEAIPLSDSVTMLTGRGGNMGLSVGADGVLLVDDQFAPLSEKILAAIGTIADRPGSQPVDLVLNTHWHGDHTGGNANFRAAGALVFAHDKVRETLLQRNFSKQAAEGAFVAAPELPVVTFSDDLTFHFNGETIRVIKVPAEASGAHTDGDVIVHFTGSDVLHMGDVFFNGLYTFFDPSSGGRFEGMIEALALGLDLAGSETRIIPGHGGLAGRAEMADHHARLVEIRERTRAAIAAGTSKADFIASQPTADLAAAYQGRYQVMKPERFLELVYDDLAQ
ncbi:MAG: MBL fold metallo-hydrolase [Kiloniellales bacterium]|nr:MBL fold metallo-hydrolase [Kiloniellales bacterium]